MLLIEMIVLVLIALVAYGTLKRNRWGVNLASVACPRCSAPMPMLRKPASPRQALWGGWTCPACGTEIDKWGREQSTRS